MRRHDRCRVLGVIVRPEVADTLDIVIKSLSLRNGFAWWLPIFTAAAATLIAVAISQSSAVAWDAAVRLWAKEGRTASEYAELLLDPSVQEEATGRLMASEDGPPILESVTVELTDTLIRLTVRSSGQADAESLAIELAYAAVHESIRRYGDEAGLDLLGLVYPGARKVAPSTEWTAAWASVIGLSGGLALACALARRATSARSALGRLGRIGFKPIAVITAEAERAANQPTAAPSPASVVAVASREAAAEDAAMLGNVANTLEPRSGVIALVPLDHSSSVTATLFQTARTLAYRGRSVIWLDGRRPAFEIAYGAPPGWLLGTHWSPVERWELILRSAVRALETGRPNGCALLLTDTLSEQTAINLARASAGVLLMVRADVTDDQLAYAQRLLGHAPLLGVVLTQAQATDLRDFELALMSE